MRYVLAVLLAGCYHPRNIIVPPGPDSLACMRECMASAATCRERNRELTALWCREKLDNCNLRCEGAYEEKP